MTLTQVREAPHVAEPDAEAHAGQDVLGFVVPFGPVPALLLLQRLQVLVGEDPFVQPGVWEHKSHGVWVQVCAGEETLAALCVDFKACCGREGALMSEQINVRLSARSFRGAFMTRLTFCFICCCPQIST